MTRTGLMQELIRHLLGTISKTEEPHSEPLSRLTASLTKTPPEVDRLLAELAQVARNREPAVHKLERDLDAP